MYSDDGVLNIGISRIDKDHEAISRLCDKIATAINDNLPPDEIKSGVLELTTMIDEHFKDEERLFEPLHLALEKQHKEEHRVLADKLAAIADEIDQGSDTLRKNFSNFNDSLQRHISYDFEMKRSDGITE